MVAITVAILLLSILVAGPVGPLYVWIFGTWAIASVKKRWGLR